MFLCRCRRSKVGGMDFLKLISQAFPRPRPQSPLVFFPLFRSLYFSLALQCLNAWNRLSKITLTKQIKCSLNIIWQIGPTTIIIYLPNSTYVNFFARGWEGGLNKDEKNGSQPLWIYILALWTKCYFQKVFRNTVLKFRNCCVLLIFRLVRSVWLTRLYFNTGPSELLAP